MFLQIVQQTEFRERIISALNDSRSTIQTLAEILQTVDEIFVRTAYMDNMVALLTSLIDEGRNLEIDAENIANGYAKSVPLPGLLFVQSRAL